MRKFAMGAIASLFLFGVIVIGVTLLNLFLQEVIGLSPMAAFVVFTILFVLWGGWKATAKAED